MLNRQHNVNERAKFLARLIMLDNLAGSQKEKASWLGLTSQSFSRLKTGIKTSETAHLLMDHVYKEHYSTEPNSELIDQAKKTVIQADVREQLKKDAQKQQTREARKRKPRKSQPDTVDIQARDERIS